MREHYEKEAKEIKKAQGKSGGDTVIDSSGKVQAPEHLKKANYTTKASKK